MDQIIEQTKNYIETELFPILQKESESVEGNYFFLYFPNYHDEYVVKQRNLVNAVSSIKSDIKNILEIGFNAGFSALLMLFTDPSVNITCIDIGAHRYTYACYEKIKETFGSRIQFILGDSGVVLPTLSAKYDLIHIDGGHSYEIAEKDVFYSLQKMKDRCIVIMDDTSLQYLMDVFYKYSDWYGLRSLNEEDLNLPWTQTNLHSIRIFDKSSKSIISTEVIPRKIFRIWQTEICEQMQKYSDRMKSENPDFEYTVFNAVTAREFLLEHFDDQVLTAFDSLVPFSFKADLFRYCVMYIHGGIYLDMKFESVNGFRFSELLDKEQYVLDIDGNSIYNAVLVCKPRSRIMFKCIFQVLKHVRERDYTDCDLSITGPGMIKQFVPPEMKQSTNLRHTCINYNKYVLRSGIPILKNYHRYYEDTPRCGQKCYLDYWNAREVYA